MSQPLYRIRDLDDLLPAWFDRRLAILLHGGRLLLNHTPPIRLDHGVKPYCGEILMLRPAQSTHRRIESFRDGAQVPGRPNRPGVATAGPALAHPHQPPMPGRLTPQQAGGLPSGSRWLGAATPPATTPWTSSDTARQPVNPWVGKL